jgi:hypothetical protein
MKEGRQKVINYLKENKDVIGTKEATIGVDAFIDKIVRVIQTKTDKDEYIFFNDIGQFGNHLVSKAGKSCGIEINERFTKLGGNAPIMANALGSLSVKVNCIGALGYPEIETVFKELSDNCKLFTIGNPGYTTALEFNDGKVMLSQRDYLHKINWNTVKNVLGIETLKSFFETSALVGLVNWNGMIHFNEIFRGILDEVLKDHIPNKSKVLFFDLADFSERSREDLIEAVKLINEFNKHFKVILGLNENEAILMYKYLFPEKEITDLMAVGQFIYDNLEIDALVIHTLTSSIAYESNGIVEAPSLYVKKPKLSTGGGDNFNAGLCFGHVIGLDMEGALYTANATSGYYVRNAKSPNIENLIETLENWDALIEQP